DQLAAQSRRRPASPAATPAACPAPRFGLQADADSNKAFAQQLLARAKQSEKDGDVKTAASLARRAEALPTEWKPGEQSPAQYLAQLDAQSRPRDLGRPGDTQLAGNWEDTPRTPVEPASTRSNRLPP